LLFVLFVGISCKEQGHSNNKNFAATPEELNRKVTGLLKQKVVAAIDDSGRSLDSVSLLDQIDLCKNIYEKNGYSPLWSKGQDWLSSGDSLYHFIKNARLYGLYPADYHYEPIKAIRERFFIDSLAKGDRKDALLWTVADMLLTDGFLCLIEDIKLGRLPNDSVTLRKDTVLSEEFYIAQFKKLQGGHSLTLIAEALEPQHPGYKELKTSIKNFLANAQDKDYTLVPLPGNDLQKFKKALQRRLFEGGYIAYDSVAADSVQLAAAVKKFQQEKGITVDGRAGEGTIRMLNVNDKERFARIAISMDKYKMLPETMPKQYVWVNAAANYLQLLDGGEVKIKSRVITGKLKTRTPMLTSAINALITYPQWVPPPSIVQREILPAVKKNPGYLNRKGFSLLDKDGNEVDPYTVNWAKYTKGVPYRIVQGSGDANALGIMKFVFDNKYSVYLHDTNQRYLFGNAMRSLSHGCVRVQEWQPLAFWLLKNDSIASGGGTRVDSVKTWLANKQKRTISLRNKVPVYIRYITCEGQAGKVIFFDDVYGDDKVLRERYFAGK
jgi:murein L,D-transpeptidase YcbB/YkuD